MSGTIKAVGRLITAVGILVVWPGCQSVSFEEGRGESSYSWRRGEGSIALLRSKRVVWQFNYRKEEGRPYFHPLSLTDGTVLTSLRPADHPWHRALWFSWKYINGVDYWDPELPAGQTEIVDVKTKAGRDYSGQIEVSIIYHRGEEAAVLSEERRLLVSAPDEGGCYYIDWLSVFRAGDNDVLLDRTPIPGEEHGKSYGGYAGLSLRMAEDARDWQFVGSEGALEAESRGSKARWVDFSGGIGEGGFAGVTIFDHPENPRYPPSWWLSGSMPYWSPALLFEEPYTLAAGESVTLRYRVFVHRGRAAKDMLEGGWRAFAASE